MTQISDLMDRGEQSIRPPHTSSPNMRQTSEQSQHWNKMCWRGARPPSVSVTGSRASRAARRSPSFTLDGSRRGYWQISVWFQAFPRSIHIHSVS